MRVRRRNDDVDTSECPGIAPGASRADWAARESWVCHALEEALLSATPDLASLALSLSPATARDVAAETQQLLGLSEAKPEAFHRFYETWMPRVYSFALVRLGDARRSEAVARAVLEAAIASPLAWGADPAPRLLAITKREIARRRHS